ncbi:MAG: hypothetical protein P3W87_002305 [Gammaproteobacteria bacterium]|nr:hypothetical protein [Gammaproteobacteria bacterium]
MAVVVSQDVIAERLAWGQDALDVDWWRSDGWAVADEEVLAAASAARVLIDEGLADAGLAAALHDVLTAWRADPHAFDATLGSLARRADPASALAGWVEDEVGRPMPIPASHWWWRLSKDW